MFEPKPKVPFGISVELCPPNLHQTKSWIMRTFLVEEKKKWSGDDRLTLAWRVSQQHPGCLLFNPAAGSGCPGQTGGGLGTGEVQGGGWAAQGALAGTTPVLPHSLLP